MLNGVREGTGASLHETDESAKAKRKGVSMRASLELITDPNNLDATVEEIFQMMLGVDCKPLAETSAMFLNFNKAEADLESLTAVVGLGGLLSGACIFRSAGTVARRIAGLMTGMEFEAIDDTVKDGLGEICNMLAGAWKSRVPDLAAHCGLSVPAVIVGRDYSLHVQAPEFQLHHIYRFDNAIFEVTIVCDGLK